MNAIAGIRPQPLVDERATLFRLRESGELRPVPADGTVDGCLSQIRLVSQHKERFVVQVVDLRTGGATLHVYQVKRRSKPTYLPRGLEVERIQPLYVEHQHSICLDGLVAHLPLEDRR